MNHRNLIRFDWAIKRLLRNKADYSVLVYHGKTDFIGIHNADILQLSPKQREKIGKTLPSDILPEYYLIKVNQFNDIAKDSLDQWIYYFKNNEIKDEFTARGISMARELWRF